MSGIVPQYENRSVIELIIRLVDSHLIPNEIDPSKVEIILRIIMEASLHRSIIKP